MSDWAGILWLFVLLAGNAFFVGAEFAVVSARRSQIEPRADAGSRAAKRALYAMEHATLMLATAQFGVTVCSLLILSVSEPAIHHLLEGAFGLTSIPADVVGVASFVITLLIVTYLHVVFGEMVPKNLSFTMPDRAVLLLAPPLVFLSHVLKPIIAMLNWIANHIVRLFGVEPKDEATSAYTLDEVATIVTQSTREGTLDDRSGTLTAAFEFTAKRVGDVAVPLAHMVSLPMGCTPADLERAVVTHGFSRYLIVDAEGAPIGYVHLKDVLGKITEGEVDRPIPPKRIRQLMSFSATGEIEDALAAMRQASGHVGLVYSAHGQATGVLFLEDIIEELIGEVHDATRRARPRVG